MTRFDERLEERVLRSDDPSLGAEANRLLTRELRAAAGPIVFAARTMQSEHLHPSALMG
jgi:hypothetical protein